MNLKKNFKNLLGLGDDDDLYDDDYNEEYEPKESHTQELERYKSKNRDDSSRRNLYPISGGQSSSYGAKLNIVRPKTFNDSKEICDDMKQNKIIVINTGDMESKEAQRLLDFVSGAAYNAGGDVQEVEPKVFVLSPPMVEVSRNGHSDIPLFKL